MSRLACAVFFVLFSALPKTTLAVETQRQFADYTVYWSIFDSTFVTPEVAAAHGIKRSQYENLLNVSVVPVGSGAAVAAKVNGSRTNLMQQQRKLVFQEIKESDARYYLAPMTVTSEEVVHVELQIQPEGSEEILTVKFSTTLYPATKP